MSSDTKFYASTAVDLIICAIPIKDGRADDFVSVKPVGPSFDDEIGSDGEVTIFSTNERRLDVEVTLKRSSSHNQQLAAIHAANCNSTGGAGIGVFLLKDRNGATIYAADRCYIKQLPDWKFGKAIGDVTWPIRIVVSNALGAIPGGN